MGNDEVVVKKIVLLGDSAVGKTSLIRRFVHDQFDDGYISTIGAKVSKRVVATRYKDVDYEVKLMVWDIIGSKGFQSTQAKHIAGADGAILLVDLTDPKTRAGLEDYWIPLLREVTGGIIPSLTFVGNKMDLLAGEEEAQATVEFFRQMEAKYCDDFDGKLETDQKAWILTSAKTGENVERSFETLAINMLAANSFLDPMNRQIGVAKAKSIYESDGRKTTRSVMDLVIMELPHLVKSTSKSTDILQNCISRLGFSKDLPKPRNVLDFVNCVLSSASEAGANPEEVQKYRDNWMKHLSKFK